MERDYLFRGSIVRGFNGLFVKTYIEVRKFIREGEVFFDCIKLLVFLFEGTRENMFVNKNCSWNRSLFNRSCDFERLL